MSALSGTALLGIRSGRCQPGWPSPCSACWPRWAWLASRQRRLARLLATAGEEQNSALCGYSMPGVRTAWRPPELLLRMKKADCAPWRVAARTPASRSCRRRRMTGGISDQTLTPAAAAGPERATGGGHHPDEPVHPAMWLTNATRPMRWWAGSTGVRQWPAGAGHNPGIRSTGFIRGAGRQPGRAGAPDQDSQKISGILEVIGQIADQTNLPPSMRPSRRHGPVNRAQLCGGNTTRYRPWPRKPSSTGEISDL